MLVFKVGIAFWIEDVKYVCVSSVEQEQSESDTLVFHGDTGQVIVRNEFAAVLWRALAWVPTPKEFLELMKEALAAESSENLNAALAAYPAQVNSLRSNVDSGDACITPLLARELCKMHVWFDTVPRKSRKSNGFKYRVYRLWL